MKDIFTISTMIIKRKLKILTDDQKSRLKLFNKEYPFSKSVDYANIVQKISNYALIDKKAAWKAVLEKSQKKQNIPVFSKRRSWYPYAAAASIIMLFSISYLWLNKETTGVPAVANVPIEIGDSKAKLTLEDGSVIALEKGTSYNTNNAKSNGEQIIYDAKGKPKSGFNFLTVPRTGEFTVQLADGTKVWLNSESQLKYPTAFTPGEARKVELVYGEAYFEVSPSSSHHGDKFKVVNLKQEIEVIGTEFNIKAYKDESIIYTTLVKGKISLKTANTSNILTPDHQAVLDLKLNKVQISEVDVYNDIAWKEGLFSFESKPLGEIMRVLSRWYDIDVTYSNAAIENTRFTGTLKKDQKIEKVLETIKSFGVIREYKIKNKEVELK